MKMEAETEKMASFDGDRRSFRAGSRKTVHAQSTHGRGKPVKGWLGESVLW